MACTPLPVRAYRSRYTDDMAQWKGHATEPAANLLSRVYGITSLVMDQGEGLIFGSTRACKNCVPAA